MWIKCIKKSKLINSGQAKENPHRERFVYIF